VLKVTARNLGRRWGEDRHNKPVLLSVCHRVYRVFTSPQAFLDKVAAIGVQPLKIGNLDTENLLDGLFLLDHVIGGVKVGEGKGVRGKGKVAGTFSRG
jgi:hypothetical protein